MKTDDKDQVLCARFKRELDAEVDRLDEGMRVRLRQARLQALATADGRRSTVFDIIHAWRWLTRGGVAVTAAAVAAIAVWLVQPQAPHILKSAEDVEIIATQEQLELCEDLEFYRWLATSGEGTRNKGTENVQ